MIDDQAEQSERPGRYTDVRFLKFLRFVMRKAELLGVTPERYLFEILSGTYPSIDPGAIDREPDDVSFLEQQTQTER